MSNQFDTGVQAIIPVVGQFTTVPGLEILPSGCVKSMSFQASSDGAVPLVCELWYRAAAGVEPGQLLPFREMEYATGLSQEDCPIPPSGAQSFALPGPGDPQWLPAVYSYLFYFMAPSGSPVPQHVRVTGIAG
jgi:hypothetical protein